MAAPPLSPGLRVVAVPTLTAAAGWLAACLATALGYAIQHRAAPLMGPDNANLTALFTLLLLLLAILGCGWTMLALSHRQWRHPVLLALLPGLPAAGFVLLELAVIRGPRVSGLDQLLLFESSLPVLGVTGLLAVATPLAVVETRRTPPPPSLSALAHGLAAGVLPVALLVTSWIVSVMLLVAAP